MNQLVQKNFKIWGSYQAEVDNVKDFLKERFAWMDKKLGYTYKSNGIRALPLDKSQPYQVFSFSGQFCGNSIESLTPGIYFLRQESATQKIIVR